MFHHLDGNQDNWLSSGELAEIDGIQKEKCIKPFLQSCDINRDGKVNLSEFCKCLCVSELNFKLLNLPLWVLYRVVQVLLSVVISVNHPAYMHY